MRHIKGSTRGKNALYLKRKKDEKGRRKKNFIGGVATRHRKFEKKDIGRNETRKKELRGIKKRGNLFYYS